MLLFLKEIKLQIVNNVYVKFMICKYKHRRTFLSVKHTAITFAMSSFLKCNIYFDFYVSKSTVMHTVINVK